MSKKGKDILEALLDTVPKLDESKQNYLLGIAEGMAIMRESAYHKDCNKQLEEV